MKDDFENAMKDFLGSMQVETITVEEMLKISEVCGRYFKLVVAVTEFEDKVKDLLPEAIHTFRAIPEAEKTYLNNILDIKIDETVHFIGGSMRVTHSAIIELRRVIMGMLIQPVMAAHVEEKFEAKERGEQ